MKIARITLKDFKRFNDLTIGNLPESAKLIMLMGPNGCGKSSLFDAIYTRKNLQRQNLQAGSDYYFRSNDIERNAARDSIMNNVQIHFHSRDRFTQTFSEKSVYVRTAYRNTPSFVISQFGNVGSSLQEQRFNRMIDNDSSTDKNYIRLVSNAFNDMFAKESEQKIIIDFKKELMDEIRNPILSLFSDLTLDDLGKPFVDSTFRFTKGEIAGFKYENLSGGEKAAFDLILDLVIKCKEYDDTVFCIDEPEAHINPRIQGKLLRVLYDLIPDNCQLWLATHSIGMMREAYEIQKESSEKVVFLDFDNRDFDEPQTIEPAKMNRALWERTHEVVMGDIANLVMPDMLFICESTPEKSFDAYCYSTIFSDKHPNAKFISVGSKNEVIKMTALLLQTLPQLRVKGVRDRDNMTLAEIEEAKNKGVQVLNRSSIECYLFDDEVLEALYNKYFSSEPNSLLDKLKEIRDKYIDSAPKSISQNIRTHLLSIDGSLEIGDNSESFMKYTIAPLITSDMQVYKKLEADIFGTQS